jgi:hypothetical protein
MVDKINIRTNSCPYRGFSKFMHFHDKDKCNQLERKR